MATEKKAKMRRACKDKASRELTVQDLLAALENIERDCAIVRECIRETLPPKTPLKTPSRLRKITPPKIDLFCK